MKRAWERDELLDHWTLLPQEVTLVQQTKTDASRLGLALLLKWFQYEGQFPQQRREVPAPVLAFVAAQVAVAPDQLPDEDWQGRTLERHRAQIREFLGFREASLEDAEALTRWLGETQRPQQNEFEFLKAAVLARCRGLRLEPPTPGRVERLIRSAMRADEERFCAGTLARLSPDVQAGLDALLEIPASAQATADAAEPSSRGRSVLSDLKTDAGPSSLGSVLAEIAKLQRLRGLALPQDLFLGIPPKVLERYRQRLAVEELHEVRRHPDPIRYTLLAAFCFLRRQELTDTLVDLLCDLVHRLGSRAEQRVDATLLQDLKRVRGKSGLLYALAEAAVAHPDGTVREVVYPVVPEPTLRAVVQEFQAAGSYQHQVRGVMRGSYRHHYRRMLPPLLQVLEFQSNNALHRPVIQALALLRKYADRDEHSYALTEEVPLDGVVSADWQDLVLHPTKRGPVRVNRIAYELCVLQALRERLRCKEIWVVGAQRFRNPDQDLPADFAEQRTTYYADLRQPLEAATFIAREQQALTTALEELDRTLPGNPKVELRERQGKSWITLSPLVAQPEPLHLSRLKAEVEQRWHWTSLLDMLKETDLRVKFTGLFKSTTAHENLPRAVLQKRLLLCLYALGTNTGLKRVGAGDPEENYRDLLYVRRRFLSRDALRAAIGQVVNAILRVRQPQIWGEGTTACASDSKKFGAWDQNLMTEWHIRYRGPGIMVYWHVERKSACIYSQVKSCSSSEVAAMLEGVLRHCTEMEVAKNYVDSHGQSEVAFAFCSLLGFQLLPRLKGLPRQKLSRPRSGLPEAYPNLQPVLTRAIDWELIRQQYDEMIKYATALRLGTAEAEAILRRFTRNGPQHPTYQALSEYGKARKTLFLCEYLRSEALRQEIQEGLNVVENWNSANSFIFYGKGGEVATNRREEQELALLSLHLLQVSMVYINTLMLQQVLAAPQWADRLEPEDRRALTPLFYTHVNPYGIFRLNLEERMTLEGALAA